MSSANPILVLPILVLFVSVVLISCQRRDTAQEIRQLQAAEQKVMETLENSGSEGCVAIRDFRERWPSAKQDLGMTWDQEGQEFNGEVAVAVVIEGRYVFKLWSRFTMPKDLNAVTFTNPQLHFYEFKQIRKDPNGGVSITYNTASDRHFDYRDWVKMKADNWNFSSLGITIISNSPIQGVEWVANP